MFGLGMSEIILLAVLALIVIGPKELPELARTIGRFLNELKHSTSSLGDELKQQVRIDPIDFNEPAPHSTDQTQDHHHSEHGLSDENEEADQMELFDQEPIQTDDKEHKPT